MDIICPKCAEPWDVSELHEAEDGLTFSEARAMFAAQGCGPVFGARCTPATSDRDRLRADVSSAMFDLLGDDVDGCASMMEDFEYMGML